MIISEFIKILSDMPQDAVIASDGSLTWFGEPKILTKRDILNKIYLDKTKKYLYISSESLDY